MRFDDVLSLENHGPDTFVGTGPRYPWGGLYGGQIVAQALSAAAATVDPVYRVHSLRAYFIRRGDHDEPVRYEVDRLRNGRSFCTRRVVARQAVGAILNLEASFQQEEPSEDVSTIPGPMGVPLADELTGEGWSPFFERAFLPKEAVLDSGVTRDGRGRVAAWLRVTEPLGDDWSGADWSRHAAGLAYLSDDLPTDAIIRAHPMGREPDLPFEAIFNASLDHTIWFHRPMRADAWHLHEFTCHSFVNGRGLAVGHVFAADGTHTATICQEVLTRDGRVGR